MPSVDERREVAENLRTMTMCGCRYKEQFCDLLEETVMSTEDFHSFNDLAHRLADLIEPDERTCEVAYSERGCPCCGKCGCVLYSESGYCPNCGCRIKED